MRAFFLLTFLAVAVCAENQYLATQNAIRKDRNNNNDQSGRQVYAYDEWKAGSTYTYNVESRALTSLEDDQQWAGVLLRARLVLQAQSEGRLLGVLEHTQYAHVHQRLAQGAQGPLPENLEFQSYPGIERPFLVYMSGGLVQQLEFSQDMGIQEENLIKGLVGTLQYDTSSRHLLQSHNDFLDEQQANGVYRKMETDVTGKCKTLYTVAPLPMDEVQRSFWLAPFLKPGSQKSGQLLEITKTKDYSYCDKRVAYHFGVPQGAHWKRASQSADNFMSRSTVSRIIADRSNNTIYSAHAVTVVAASPVMYGSGSGKATVYSSVNVTLSVINSENKVAFSAPSPSRRSDSLIYTLSSSSNKNAGHTDSYNREENNGKESHSNYNQGKYQQQYQNNNQDQNFNNQKDNLKIQRRNKRSALPSRIENYEHNPFSQEDYTDSLENNNQQINKNQQNQHEDLFTQEDYIKWQNNNNQRNGKNQHNQQSQQNQHQDMLTQEDYIKWQNNNNQRNGKNQHNQQNQQNQHQGMLTQEDYIKWQNNYNQRNGKNQDNQQNQDQDMLTQEDFIKWRNSYNQRNGKNQDNQQNQDQDMITQEDYIKWRNSYNQRNGKNQDNQQNQDQDMLTQDDYIKWQNNNNQQNSHNQQNQQNQDQDMLTQDDYIKWQNNNNQQNRKNQRNQHKDLSSQEDFSKRPNNNQQNRQNEYQDLSSQEDNIKSQNNNNQQNQQNQHQDLSQEDYIKSQNNNNQQNQQNQYQDMLSQEDNIKRPNNKNQQNRKNHRNQQNQQNQHQDLSSQEDFIKRPNNNNQQNNKNQQNQQNQHQDLFSQEAYPEIQDDNNQKNNKNQQNQQNQHETLISQDDIKRQNGKNQQKNKNQRKRPGQQNKQNPQDSSSSSDSSSSDSSSSENTNKWHSSPNMHDAPVHILNMQPEDRVANARKIAYEIAEELQKDPNNLPKSGSLDKWNTIVLYISEMDAKQLQETTSQMYKTGSETQRLSFKLYRDALAQAGTLPAYKEIKSLILSKKIQSEEAAEVVAVLTKTLRYPTKELFTDFWNFAKSAEVRQQPFLNSTALLAVTGFINMAHVNNETAYSYYPTHFFGRMTDKNDQIVSQEVLPWLERELRNAVEKHDSHQAQVYIQAIGNLGHPAILGVFGPYLEGKHQISTFLRQHMVMNFGLMTSMYPSESRPVLFNIYQNQGVEYEVRIAAVFQLMKARPTLAMLQRMAQSTHTDSSYQVRAAIQSAIKNAATLQQPEFESLAAYARAAERMLNEKDYGFQYSQWHAQDYQSNEMNLGHAQFYSQIGSYDSFLPKSISYVWKSKLGGWMKPNKVRSVISSVSQLTELIKNQIAAGRKQSQHQGEHQSSPKYDAENIAKMLNIKGEDRQQLEANILLGLLNQQRFFAIDEQTVHNLPRMISQAYSELHSGKNFNYTKFVNTEEVVIMFPVAMGVSFYFNYKTPTMVRFNGKIQVQVQPPPSNNFLVKPDSMNVTSDIHLTYASNIDGKIGFSFTFNNKKEYYTSGVVNKFQVNIPLKIKADIDLNNSEVSVQVRPVNEADETTILHASSWPYTAIHDRKAMEPLSQMKNVKLVKSQYPEVNYERIYGQETGLAFKVKAVYEKKPERYNFLQRARNNFMSAIVNPLSSEAIQQYSYELKYDGRQSSTNNIHFFLSYDSNKRSLNNKGSSDRKQQGNFWSSPSDATKSSPSDDKVGSQRRRSEILQKVATPGAHAQLIDIGLQFSGKKSAQYVATAAISRSPVSEKLQAIFYYSKMSTDNKKFNVLAAASVKIPNTPILNFEKALKFETYSDLDVAIKYGQQVESGASIGIHAKVEQTQELREYLRRDPVVKRCQQEMQRGNNMMPACMNVTVKANTMDHLKLSLSYNKIGDQAKHMTQQLYNFIRYFNYYNLEEDFVSYRGEQNKVDLEMRLYPGFDKMNLSISTPVARILFNEIQMNEWTRSFVSVHPSVAFYERFLQRAYGFYPSCSVETTQINTFSNKVIDYTVDDCWHVVMQNGSHQGLKGMESYQQQTTVLVRSPSNQQKEVYINYRAQSGNQVTVELNQNKMTVNGKQEVVSDNQVYTLWNNGEESELLSAWKLPSGEMIINIDENQLQVIYDGQRLYLEASESYKNTSSGICGAMTGEKNDLLTPRNCFFRDEALFAASYSLPQQQCQGQSRKLQQQVQRETCVQYDSYNPAIYSNHYYEENNRFNGVNNDDFASSSSSESSSSSSENVIGKIIHLFKTTKHWGQKKDSVCKLQRRVQFIEANGEICITYRSLPACPETCNPQQMTQLPVKAVCKSDKDQQFIMYKEQIKKGENPQINEIQQPSNRQIVFSAPTKC